MALNVYTISGWMIPEINMDERPVRIVSDESRFIDVQIAHRHVNLWCDHVNIEVPVVYMDPMTDRTEFCFGSEHDAVLFKLRWL